MDDPQIHPDCINTYMLYVLAAEIQPALDNYTAIMEDHYESKFNSFAKVVKQGAPEAMKRFYNGDMDKYCTCNYTVPRYILDRDLTKPLRNPDNIGILGVQDVTDPACPPNNYPDKPDWAKDLKNWAVYNTTFVITDQELFCQKASADYGLECDWMYDRWLDTRCSCLRKDCHNLGYICSPWVKKQFEVFDPSSEIGDSLSKFQELAEWLIDATLLDRLGLLTESTGDAVDAASVVVVTIQAAVEAMQQVSDIGRKVEKEEEKALIFSFISAVLCVIPALAPAARAVVAARYIAFAAEAGIGGLAVYDAVRHPENAPLAVVEIMLGAIALGEIGGVSRAGKISRGLSRDSIAMISKRAATKMDKVRHLRNVCGK